MTPTATPPDLSGFLAECDRRGISLSLGAGPNGETLRVSGRAGGTPPPALADYLRRHKPALVALLKAEPQEGDTEPAWRALLARARAETLPIETVTLGPGTTTSNPNKCALAAAGYLRDLGEKITSGCGDENQRRIWRGLMEKECATLDALCEWWRGQSFGANDREGKQVNPAP